MVCCTRQYWPLTYVQIMAKMYLNCGCVLFGRCGGTGGHGQRGAVGGADHVHGAGADVGRVPVLPAAVGFRTPRSVPAGWRHGRLGWRIQPAPPAPPTPSPASQRAAAAVAPVAQPHAVVRTARVRRTGRAVRQRGQRVTSTAPPITPPPPPPQTQWPAPLAEESSAAVANPSTPQ